jgi:NAD(P)H dehydrogenase (quinone)
MTYLITGATGGFAGYALEQLKGQVPASDIHVLVHNATKAADLKAAGYNVHIGDYLNPASLQEAFTGIDRVLFISSSVVENRQAQHANVIQAAKAAGVKFIAYTSFANAAEAANTNALAVDHNFTEQAIKKAGIAHTFLRNNWYLENEMPLVGSALANGKFVFAAEDGQAGWALKREYAEVAAKVLVGKQEFAEVLELSGQPVTYATLAAALEEATGKTLEVVKGTDEEVVAQLELGGLPNFVATLFLGFQKDIKSGVLNVASTDFEQALGHPLTPLAAAFKELLR